MLVKAGQAVRSIYENIQAKRAEKEAERQASEEISDPKSEGDINDLGDADIGDLDKLSQDVINENGRENFTQELKREGGKSKSDLYWDKDGNIYTVPKNGGPPQWVGWLPG